MKPDSPLQRGKACLCCRKRKMRCDGIRPVCSQCIKSNRDSECQYYDKKQVSRTQLLQQKVAKLEARLKELESEQSDSSLGSPAPSAAGSSCSSHSETLIAQPGSSTNPSVTSSPAMTFINGWDSSLLDDSPFPGTSSGPSSYSPFLLSPSLSGPSLSSDFVDDPLYLDDALFHPSTSTASLQRSKLRPSTTSPNWWENPNTFCQHKQMLLDIFLTHRHQCAFDVHIGRFQASLALSYADQPHPALMDAIYLIACHFSRTPQLAALESHFLKRALCGISDALQHSDRIINVLQASCLLALYFFGRGRILEGYYHSSIAARLAVSLGLHQIKSDNWFQLQLALAGYAQSPPTISKSSVQLSPPKDAVETEERISAFWQVFTVDRAWSVATGLPAAIPDDDHPQAQVETSWPTPLAHFDTVVLSEHMLPRYDSVTPYPTLRAKAVALFERTFRISSSSLQGDAFWHEHRSLEMSVSQLAANLPCIGISGGQAPLSLADLDLLTIHTIIHVSVIHLHRDFMVSQPDSFEKSLVSANSVTSLLRELTSGDYDYLDPISSTCWTSVADVYVKALASAQIPLLRSTFEQELDILMTALSNLSKLFPIAGIHVAKIERDRTSARTGLAAS